MGLHRGPAPYHAHGVLPTFRIGSEDRPKAMDGSPEGSKGVVGGICLYWVAGGQAPTETSGSLREIILQPFEMAGDPVVSDRLLRTWEAASALIDNLLRQAATNTEDVVILKGNGVGKPTGIQDSAGALAVKRNTANSIKYSDIVYMVAPESAGRAIWVANVSTLPQLMLMKDDAGNLIFVRGDATRGIPNTLPGIPIRWMGKTSVLGSKGDRN